MQELFIPSLIVSFIAIGSRHILIYAIAAILWYLTLIE